MVSFLHVFSGFSVDDLNAAKAFYGDTLGLTVIDNEDMGLKLQLPDGASIFVYEKPNHEPASYTIMNLVVNDIDTAVAEMASKGIVFEHYDMPGMEQDDKAIARGRAAGNGPDIAWFKDPAGNILSVLQN